MIAGCPLDDRLLRCLAHNHPDALLVFLATLVGFVLVWRRWAPLLVAILLAGLWLLLRRWGVMA